MSRHPAMNVTNKIRGTLPKNVVGIVGLLEWALAFARWASLLREPPTWEQISERWDVSRATAYRYKSAWEAAVGAGMVPLPRDLRSKYHTKHNGSLG